MKDLVDYITTALVDDRSSVHVEERIERNATVYQLYVADGETGRVIGREGKIANALRLLMDCSMRRDKKQHILKIM
ncbi:MAG: KH domain-containing protein [Chloroflexota bacterium]|jgi:hypothetical protein